MKRLIAFVFFNVLLSNVLLAQWEKVEVSKSSLILDHPFKAPDGTVWVDPLHIFAGKGKNLPDTLELVTPKAARFYYDKNLQDSVASNLNETYAIFNQIAIRSANASIEKALYPFVIKQWEVTNIEYLLFMKEYTNPDKLILRPDTTCWQSDFPNAYNEPMRMMYFNHPKYDNYPVVGVSYYQAKAFCKWYEDKLNSALKVDGFTLKVDLPNQFEWAFANGDGYTYWRPSDYLEYKDGFYDSDYLTNLYLHTRNSDRYELDKMLSLGVANINTHTFISDGYMYPHTFSQRKKVKSPVHEDCVNEVFYLNNNVSEWCSETYQDNWKDLFALRQQFLKNQGTTGGAMASTIERYYHSCNDTLTGQMVRGGNWFHEQHAFRDGVNVGTHSAKVFINPNEQHSTLGFRYVIRLIPLPTTAKH